MLDTRCYIDGAKNCDMPNAAKNIGSVHPRWYEMQ